MFLKTIFTIFFRGHFLIPQCSDLVPESALSSLVSILKEYGCYSHRCRHISLQLCCES